MKKSSDKMIIPIVDEGDNFLYYKDYDERDRQKEITRVSAVWVMNEKGEVLIARRSVNKHHFPGKWASSASGYLEEGETYEENVIKEAQEEIGIILESVSRGPKMRESDDHEFFNQYFFAQIHSDAKFTLQEEEVDEVRWVTLEELQSWYSKSPEDFTPSFDVSLKVIENHEAQNKKT